MPCWFCKWGSHEVWLGINPPNTQLNPAPPLPLRPAGKMVAHTILPHRFLDWLFPCVLGGYELTKARFTNACQATKAYFILLNGLTYPAGPLPPGAPIPDTLITPVRELLLDHCIEMTMIHQFRANRLTSYSSLCNIGLVTGLVVLVADIGLLLFQSP